MIPAGIRSQRGSALPGFAGFGGGGGGQSLGPETNEFTGASESAAETARDAYATANADWLAQYDAEPTYTIILTYGTTTTYQARRGSAWADVTPIIRGPAGTATAGSDTAAQILTKLLTVDGAGSGLDADLLDGMTPAQVAALIQTASTTAAGIVQLGSSADLRTDANRGRAAQIGSVYTVVREWLANLVAVPTIAGQVLTFTDFDGDTHTVTLPSGSGGGLTQAQVDARITALAALLTGATFTGAVEIGSSSGTALTADGTNAGNSTIMKIVTPDSGTQKAFGAGRDGEFDWVQFAGEVVSGKPGFALGPGTARDTNLYRDAANVLKTDDAFVAEGTVSGATPTADGHLTTKAYVDTAVSGAGGGFTLRTGAGAPANSLGDDGDWYLRTSNGQWLERASGSYVLRYTDMLGTSGGGQTESQVNTLIQAALAAAVTGNTETGISVTHNADGTLDFVVGQETHDLIVGWSANASISDTELGAGASPASGGAHNVATLPTGTGNQYLFIWRADSDGGDPSEVHIAGGGNQRNIFGSATARTYNGTAGQLIVSVTTQNVGLLGGEQVRVV